MIVLEKKLDINSKYYLTILKLLKSAGGNPRLIGGCVRDTLLGNATSDIDIATSIFPEQTIEILSKQGINTLPTGLKFGTVSAFIDDEKFEITTLRTDIDSRGRHTKVSFTDNFETDAARRDFTINALSYCPFNHKIYDYFSGINDLEQSKVIFIGDPKQRITEDYLRILRFFRFSCIYAKELDQPGLDACIELKNNLSSLSKERIKWEIDKLIIQKKSPQILQTMFNNGILQLIFPSIKFNPEIMKKYINLSNINRSTLYALLFFDQPLSLTKQDLIKLKFTKLEARDIISILHFINSLSELTIDFMLKKTWLEVPNYLDYINAAIASSMLNQSKADEFTKQYISINKPSFPVKGHDLLKIGISNIELGKCLENLKKIWIDSNFKLNKEELIAQIHFK
jgi:poly(A) polymerase